ncbi:MAG: CopG family antitoxin [Actinomycetota bacterium]
MGEHVPGFRSREEEARFWERTELQDLSPDEATRVELKARRPRRITFAIRLEPETVDLLREVARLEGLGVTQLARAWILSRLRAEQRVGALAKSTTDFPAIEEGVRGRLIDTLLSDRLLIRFADAVMEQIEGEHEARDEALG